MSGYPPEGPIAALLGRLKGVRRSGDGWQALCPAHSDHSPSLSIEQGDQGQVLVHCHVGCDVDQVTSALGLKVKDLFPSGPSLVRKSSPSLVTAYSYRDLQGAELFQVCRFEPKSFRQRRRYEDRWAWGLKAGKYKRGRSGDLYSAKPRDGGEGVVELPGVERVLYRLPEILVAVSAGRWIVLCEGEKDADNGAQLDLATTSNPQGAGKWQRSFTETLEGARVAIAADADTAGRQHAEKVAATLFDAGLEIRILDLGGRKKGFDLTDWIEIQKKQGRSKTEIHLQFSELIENTPPWMPSGRLLTIKIGPDQMRVVDQAVNALTRRADVYQRAGSLVQIVQEESLASGVLRSPVAPTIKPMMLPRVREILSDAALWESQEGKAAHPPVWAVKALIARSCWPGVSRLEAVVEMPVLRHDGSVLQEPGYDHSTGLLYRPSVQFERIPPDAGQAEAGEAAQELMDVVGDFPFSSKAHLSGWMAAILTLLARFAFEGPAPLFLIDSNVRGSGKSLLADVISAATLGRPAARMAPAEKDSEERKRITALAIAGDPLILIDNVSDALGSAALDAALTGTTWTDRILGQSERVNIPLLATWLATGNNVVLRADTSRRVVHIRLDSGEEFPERRSDFRRPRLLQWVQDHRPSLVKAGLTLLAAYCNAGKPDQGLSAWGGFENWSALVRNAIVWVGLPDPGDTRQALQEEADRDRELLDQLLTSWSDAFSKQPTSAFQILQRLGDDRGQSQAIEDMRVAVSAISSSAAGELPSPRTFGNRLKAFRNRVVNGRVLVASKKTKHGNGWRVESVGPIRGDSDDSGDSLSSL